MALNTNVAKAAVKAAVNAVVDSLDVGTATGTTPRMRIYDGSQPASPDAAITTQTLLAEIPLDTPAAFGAAATGTGGEASYIIATAGNLPATDTAATATGTASWFRAIDLDDTAVIDGSVGANTTSFDAAIDNVNIAAGQNVKLNSWKIRLPYK